MSPLFLESQGIPISFQNLYFIDHSFRECALIFKCRVWSLPWSRSLAATPKWALGPRQPFAGGRDGEVVGPQGADFTASVRTALALVSQEDYSKSPIFSCISASGKGKVIFKENSIISLTC